MMSTIVMKLLKPRFVYVETGIALTRNRVHDSGSGICAWWTSRLLRKLPSAMNPSGITLRVVGRNAKQMPSPLLHSSVNVSPTTAGDCIQLYSRPLELALLLGWLRIGTCELRALMRPMRI